MKKTIYISLICLLSLASCLEKEAVRGPLSMEFDRQAHRGGRGLMPENTIEAMLDAMDRNVNTLELDLQITNDKQVLVSHDPYFNKDITTTPQGDSLSAGEAKSRLLYTMSYDSIQKYDVGLRVNPSFPLQKKVAAKKPLLSDMIAATEKKATQLGKTFYYNIEIKSKAKGDSIIHPPVDEFVTLAMDAITKAGIADKVTIQTFDVRALKLIHDKYPSIVNSYLIDAKEKRNIVELGEALGFLPDVLSPHHSIVTPEMLQLCHDNNVKVIPWTVNDIETIQKLKDMGVDGIITDFPNLFDEMK